MANLFENEAKKSISVKTLIILFAMVTILIGSVISYKATKPAVEDATEVLIGVHVKGAVVNEGYYEVPLGIRVHELESVVGGFIPETDLNGVNLAEFVRDGDEVYFPYKGTAQTGAVNLNTATIQELMEVDGIGENYARKIISYRNEHERFEKVIELRSILGVNVYNSVREKFYVE